jgi:hypothetical protein
LVVLTTGLLSSTNLSQFCVNHLPWVQTLPYGVLQLTDLEALTYLVDHELRPLQQADVKFLLTVAV